jgi:hypothetical protein
LAEPGVEVWFGIIARQAIHRGSFVSVRDLMIKVRAFINGWNARCQPFVGTKTTDVSVVTRLVSAEPRPS